jgi:hypothetical protein
VQSEFTLHRRTIWVPLQLVPSVVGQLWSVAHITMGAPFVQLGIMPPVIGMCVQHTWLPPPQSPGLRQAKPPSICPPELDDEPELEPLLLPELLPLELPELDPLLLPELEPLPLPELLPLEPPELDPLLPLELDPLFLPVSGALVPLQPATTTTVTIPVPSAVNRESAVRM